MVYDFAATDPDYINGFLEHRCIQIYLWASVSRNRVAQNGHAWHTTPHAYIAAWAGRSISYTILSLTVCPGALPACAAIG